MVFLFALLNLLTLSLNLSCAFQDKNFLDQMNLVPFALLLVKMDKRMQQWDLSFCQTLPGLLTIAHLGSGWCFFLPFLHGLTLQFPLTGAVIYSALNLTWFSFTSGHPLSMTYQQRTSWVVLPQHYLPKLELWHAFCHMHIS